MFFGKKVLLFRKKCVRIQTYKKCVCYNTGMTRDYTFCIILSSDNNKWR